jgi:hypothetical protein
LELSNFEKGVAAELRNLRSGRNVRSGSANRRRFAQNQQAAKSHNPKQQQEHFMLSLIS